VECVPVGLLLPFTDTRSPVTPRRQTHTPQFYVTLADELSSLDERHTLFGQVRGAERVAQRVMPALRSTPRIHKHDSLPLRLLLRCLRAWRC
jgi:hypothetical protein